MGSNPTDGILVGERWREWGSNPRLRCGADVVSAEEEDVVVGEEEDFAIDEGKLGVARGRRMSRQG